MISSCYIINVANGSIAQLGEHLPYKQRVTGSSPVVPTNKKTVTFVAVFFIYELLEARTCDKLLQILRLKGALNLGKTVRGTVL